MSIKISELPSASSVTSSDAIPIVQSGTTKKVTVGTMLPTIATSITSSSTNDEVAGAKAVYDNSLDVYSTTEKRVGTWIDGKPLYKMFIYSQNAQCVTDGTSVSKILQTINNVDAFLLVLSSMLTSSGNFSITLPAYTTSLSLRSRVVLNKNTNTNELQVKADNSVTGYNDYIVYCSILYTKTTDTATRGTEQLKSTNSGSLVGMGDRAEVFEQVSEQVEETKSAEVDKLESEEGSGDSR